MRNAYKTIGGLFKCDPYSKIWKYYIATAERLYMLQAIVSNQNQASIRRE